MTFLELNLIAPILNALNHVGYTTPTPIQEKAIPIILSGTDIMGCAQTGTGKTAAFAIPILQQLTLNQRPEGRRRIRTLILTPTRELAIQIEDNIKAYGKELDHRHAVIFGGVSQHGQVNQLKNGVDILVATPGRLLDLVQQGFVDLRHLEIFVLDEADRMLDMGFIHDVKRVIKLIPAQRQTLFFSATMPKEIKVLASTILTDPEQVIVTPVSSTAETIQQGLYYVNTAEKKDLLLQLLNEDHTPSILVFTRTKHGADRIVKILAKAQITAAAIHGNKSQNARQNALNGFKNNKLRVLVATDIAARGIDIDELELVINYDIPNIPETYVHRIGRTGRAGASGRAISFCDQDERAYVRDIQKLIGIQIPVLKNN
jgi:ATP-dependent RNA helicase RhlE